MQRQKEMNLPIQAIHTDSHTYRAISHQFYETLNELHRYAFACLIIKINLLN